MAACRWKDDALWLDLQIQTRAARNELVGLHGERLKIRITAVPIEGRANRHLLEFMAELFGVPQARVTLIRGETSRAKSVRIERPTRIPPLVAAALETSPHV